LIAIACFFTADNIEQIAPVDGSNPRHYRVVYGKPETA
jgi:hypothetical protein